MKVQKANVEVQRTRVTGEAGPALYLAKLFGSDDAEAMASVITALLVLVLDPLAVLLTLAATILPQKSAHRPIGHAARVIVVGNGHAYSRLSPC